LILLLLFFSLSRPARPLQIASQTDQSSQIAAWFQAGEWEKVIEAVPESPSEPADLELDRGLALAQLQRWDEAESAFRTGLIEHRRDRRFRVELAGIAYRKKNYKAAKKYLRSALALDPSDSYANNFLASVYYLEGNLEAALKYWNRAARPRLADLAFEPKPGLNPLLLDRAIPFSPDEIWTRDQFLWSDARLEALDLFPQRHFDLAAQPDGSFDLRVNVASAEGWSLQHPESWLSLLRGLGYETVYPEFFNVNHDGLNWLSAFRWNDQMRWVHSEIAAPLEQNPDLRFRVYLDARNENWNLSGTDFSAVPSTALLNLEKISAGAEFRAIAGVRWQWSAEAEYSYRRFRNLFGIPQEAGFFFTDGSTLDLRGAVQRSLIRFPERRLTVDSSASGEIGTFFGGSLGDYQRLRGGLSMTWFPRARTEDFEFQSAVRAGGTFGRVPFDRLFMLGFDRDNDLWLRGHPDLRDSRKGEAPLGRDYFLFNSEWDKILYQGAFVTLKAGPLLDSGRIYDPSGYFGSREWLWDTGVQTKVRVLDSVQFVFGYGRDLRSGINSFFTTVSR
jgi:tetratricopeptide (TPR) repeat protein